MLPLRRSRVRAGFTLIELMLAMGVLAILSYNIFSVMSAAQKLTGEEAGVEVLDDQAQTVMRRMAAAIMAASSDSLTPANPAAVDTPELRYRAQLGIEDGALVWDDPELIGMDEDVGEVIWSENPGTAEERRVVWTRAVRPFLEGEIMNGIDDNGNGLIDEKGLSFVVDRNAVTIRLSMERRDRDGHTFTTTAETTVTCRNPQVLP